VPEVSKIDPFFTWLFERAEVSAELYRPRSLARRLDACLRRLKAPSGAAARGLLERRPELLPEVLDVALIGVSSFFRDGDVFRSLKAEIKRAFGTPRTGLRVLSAGCAEGQELYSVGILLDDLGMLGSSELVGVDCRPGALERAQRGQFSPEQLDQVNPARRERYFRPVGTRFEVRDFLRNRTRWVREDLLHFQDPSGVDLLLCRNVVIFMTPAGAANLWARLSAQLHPGGLLVTGKAEKPPPFLSLRRVCPSVYRKD
jgi:chemotaxis methyl-accepting protein methylase